MNAVLYSHSRKQEEDAIAPLTSTTFTSSTNDELDQDQTDQNTIKLTDFVTDFGNSLVDAVNQQNPPVFQVGNTHPYRDLAMDGLLRTPFPSQRNAVHAISSLLFDHGEKAAVLNAEMGTGKTMMAISTAAVAYQEGYQRSMVICPPHLVYKWKREILETISDATVWILNGPDTLLKLLKLREMVQGGQTKTDHPEFFIIGRVRMLLQLFSNTFVIDKMKPKLRSFWLAQIVERYIVMKMTTLYLHGCLNHCKISNIDAKNVMRHFGL